MKINRIILLAILALTYWQCEPQRVLTKSNDRLIVQEFKSQIFENSRKLRIYLPADYYENKKTTYRTLYFNDGQFLFGDDPESTVEWRVDETIDSLVARGKIEPLIVIGIDNAGKDRANEYLPWADEYLHPPLPDPQGKKYPEFLKEEIIPFVETHFRVRKDKETRGLGGSSYGGLITLYSIITAPELFGFAIIESPSLYVENQRILALIPQLEIDWPDKIYLGVGTNELGLENCDEQNEDNQMAVEDLETLEELINRSGQYVSIKKVVEHCAVHSEKSWSRRFPTAVKTWNE